MRKLAFQSHGSLEVVILWQQDG